MSNTMRAMVLERPGTRLRLVHRAVPAPGAGQVLIAVEACGVCRTDLHLVDGERPDAVLQGFTVQPMVRLAHAHECIVGASVDPVFGPVVLFGAGGVAVEVLGDRALGLPPLNMALARAQHAAEAAGAGR